MEIPKEIRYEFTLMFTGLAMLIFPFWLYFYQNEFLEKMLNSTSGLIGLSAMLSGGLAILFYGFVELTNNYTMEREIFIRKYRLKRYELDKKLKKLPPAYLVGIKFPEEEKIKNREINKQNIAPLWLNISRNF